MLTSGTAHPSAHAGAAISAQPPSVHVALFGVPAPTSNLSFSGHIIL
jgi:hypothetical protein